MATKRRLNVMRVFVGDKPLEDGMISGERLLLLPTWVKGWQIAIGESDAVKVRDALVEFTRTRDREAAPSCPYCESKRHRARTGDTPE